MRMMLLLVMFTVVPLPIGAYASELTLDDARQALRSADPVKRRAGYTAVLKLVRDAEARDGMSLFEMPGDPSSNSGPSLASLDRSAIATLLDAAVDDPALPTGWNWIDARVAVEREPSPGGYGSSGPGERSRVIYPNELKRYLPRVATSLAHKRDDVVGASVELLMAYDAEAEGIPAAVARSWPHMSDDLRAFLLTERWPRVAGPAVAAVLTRSLAAPKRSIPWHNTDHLPSLYVKHAMSFAPKRARELVLEDMQRLAPRFTRDALLALPDKALPAMESLWTKHLADRAHGDVEKLALLAERYGTADMMPIVLKTYRSAKGGWACNVQRALLGFMLKHDQALGIREVEKALARRGPKQTGCYRSVLRDALPPHWSPAAETLALKSLQDDEFEVVRDAAHALIQAGSRAAFEPLLARIVRLDFKKPPERDVRSDLLTRMCIDQTRWVADAALRKKLIAALKPSERDYLQLESITK